jgi:hypothetical protein
MTDWTRVRLIELQDLVVGSDFVERPANSMRPIAVRITDMAGEGVPVVEERAGH